MKIKSFVLTATALIASQTYAQQAQVLVSNGTTTTCYLADGTTTSTACIGTTTNVAAGIVSTDGAGNASQVTTLGDQTR